MIYIAGPDGKPMAFANEAEVEAYRRARREAEPPLLRCLRKHHAKAIALEARAQHALEQRRGRTAALDDIKNGLRSLMIAMGDDIAANSKQGEPNMTDDDVKWVGALVDCAYKSWAVRLAEGSPPNTTNFTPSWDDVDRLVAEIIETIESSAALRWSAR